MLAALAQMKRTRPATKAKSDADVRSKEFESACVSAEYEARGVGRVAPMEASRALMLVIP